MNIYLCTLNIFEILKYLLFIKNTFLKYLINYFLLLLLQELMIFINLLKFEI